MYKYLAVCIIIRFAYKYSCHSYDYNIPQDGWLYKYRPKKGRSKCCGCLISTSYIPDVFRRNFFISVAVGLMDHWMVWTCAQSLTQELFTHVLRGFVSTCQRSSGASALYHIPRRRRIETIFFQWKKFIQKNISFDFNLLLHGLLTEKRLAYATYKNTDFFRFLVSTFFHFYSNWNVLTLKLRWNLFLVYSLCGRSKSQ